MMSRTGATRRTTRRAYLPIVIGPIVLAVCWICLGILAGAQHAACWGGFDLTQIAGPLALNYRMDPDVGPALPLLGYAAQSISAFVLLFLCAIVAVRRRSRRILVAISAFGTLGVLLYCGREYVVAGQGVGEGSSWCCDVGL